MKKTILFLALVLLVLAAFAQTAPRGFSQPAALYVKRHEALDKYPLKNGCLDQLEWKDFELKGQVRKMYIQSSDLLWEPALLYDHVIVRFDSLGKVHSSITYTHNPIPNGFRYHYREDGQLERVKRYAWHDGMENGTDDLDDIYPIQGDAARYHYDDDGYLNLIEFFGEDGNVELQHLYSYTADGYNIEIQYTTETRRFRNQRFYYNRQGKLAGIQKKNMDGKFNQTASYSYNSKANTVTILQDYLNGQPTQKTLEIYDAAGRLKEKKVTDPQGNLMRKYSHSYNGSGWLVKTVYDSPNDKMTSNYSYETDEHGNVTEYVLSDGKGKEGLRLSVRYEYF